MSIEKIRELLKLAKPVKRDYALFMLQICTAFRESDLLKLKVSDVFQNGEIVHVLRVKMKKTSAWVEHPLRRDCRTALHAWITSRKDRNPYLFCAVTPGKAEQGYPLHRSAFHRIIRSYLERIYHPSALQGCSTHTLRRSMGKIVYKKTGEIAMSQHLLGHTSPAHTVRYLDPDEIRERTNEVVMELEIEECVPGPKVVGFKR